MPKLQLDDMEMFYTIDDFTDPWKRPDTLLLHHGMGGNHKMWYAWVPALARKYRVIRIDARGHGQSSVPPADYASWSAQQLAKDARDALDKLGVDKVHFIGYSFGGAVGQTFAKEYPERVKSLVLCSTSCNFTKRRDDWIAIIDEKGVEAQIRHTAAARFNFETTPPELMDWFFTEVGKTPASSLKGLLRYRVDLSYQLPHIKVPTLILAARHDTITPLEHNEYMAKTIPNAELVVFDNVPHNISIQCPDLCTKKVLEFLEKVTS